jgi:hypothetical protein
VALLESYEIGQDAQYRAIEAEFERCWREQMNQLNERRMPLIYRLLFGVSTIMLGLGMIGQTFLS